MEQGLERSQAWCEELRSERNAAQERLRGQDSVLARLYTDRVEDQRLLAQLTDWLQTYVARMVSAEEEVARLRAQVAKETTMEITIVRFERLFNTGDYNNQKIMVEATVNPGEDPQAALDALRALVAANDPRRIEAQAIVADPDNYVAWEVRQARKLLGLPPIPDPPLPAASAPPEAAAGFAVPDPDWGENEDEVEAGVIS